MVSFSNSSLSGEASNKRPLENGCVPKYKPRKISVVRDFPPGCGRNAVPMNLKPEENQSSVVGIMDRVGAINSEMTNAVVVNGSEISGMANLMKSEAVEISEISKLSRLNEIKESEIPNFVGCDDVKNPNIEMECQSRDAGVGVDSIVERVVSSVDVSKKLVRGNGPTGIQSPDEVASHGHEAVNNPIEIERDVSLCAYIGEVTTTIMNGFLHGVEKLVPETDLTGGGTINDTKSVADSGGQTTLQELKELKGLDLAQNSGVELAKSTLDADASVEKELLLSNFQALSPLCGSIKPQTPIRPKDKYRLRRVSAFREFPPHCGSHVPLSIEEDKLMARSGSDCLNRIEKVQMAQRAAMTRNVLTREIAEYVLMTSQEECLDRLQDIPVKNEATETLNGGAERGVLGETAEGSLMAAPHCSWRKTKVALKSSDGSRSGPKARQQKIQKPQAIVLNANLKENYSGGPSPENTSFPDSYDADGNPGPVINIDEEDCGAYDEHALEITPISMFKAELDNNDNDYAGPIGNDIIVYSPGDTDEMRSSLNVFISEDEVDRKVVHGLMAATYCPWRKGKTFLSNFNGEMSGEKKRKQNLSWRQKAKAVAKKSNPKIYSSVSPSKKRSKVHISNDADESHGAMVRADDECDGHDGDFPTNSPANHKPLDFEVSLPPFGPKISGRSDARNRVRETLRWFHAIYRKLLQQEEANSMAEEEGKSRQSGKKNRIDLMTAKALKDKGKLVNTVKMIGQVPGVEIGDEFQYRVELAVVGIHFPYQSGIDSMKLNDVPVATSIVASGGYSDNLDDADVLIYSGQGGNVIGKAKQPEDQKLERGNLALSNSISSQTPVRVVRGWKETKYVDPLDLKPKMVTTYIYDGLYMVTNYWIETGPHGKQVFQFELKRNPGQPELAWKELRKSSKSKTRPGVCITDISGGKEPFPICAVNTLDNETPPLFNYISKMMYPDWYRPILPAGCDCTGRCSDSRKCRCAVRNGGEIPYNHNGALVETQALVYECGPHCKCPSSCYNRVTQRGIKFKLEVFKTESRGWGVRPLTSIPSGSFICEYAGELLEDKEAEKRIGNDEYLFDIGQNYIASSEPEKQEIAAELMEGGFTIDACQYGNVGRFINHSCSPNLHAQNVIYDHDDKRKPHIMLFAMENVPPLQELTYHYNYTVDQVLDSNGNIKTKKCYCGAVECTGRMY